MFVNNGMLKTILWSVSVVCLFCALHSLSLLKKGQTGKEEGEKLGK